MNIAVFGLSHSGCLTAARLARAGFEVAGLDFDRARVNDLRRGVPPSHQPELTATLTGGLDAGKFRVTTDPGRAVAGADLVVVTLDTPVENGRPDVRFFRDQLEALAPALRPGTVVLICSHVTAEFYATLARDWNDLGVHVCYSPGDLWIGNADAVSAPPTRVYADPGQPVRPVITALFAALGGQIEWETVGSAAMTGNAAKGPAMLSGHSDVSGGTASDSAAA